MKNYKRLILSSFSFAFLVISLSFSSFAQEIPDIYRFIPKETVISLYIKSLDDAWSIINKNSNFKNPDFLFNQSGKDNDGFNISDPAIRNNIGNNLVIGMPGFNAKNTKSEPFFLAVEMKNTKLHSFIKDKISRKLLANKDTRLVKSTYKDSEIFSFIPKDIKNNNFKPSYFVFLKNYIVSAKNASTVQDIIKSYYNPEENSIIGSGNFIKSFKILDGNFQVQSYLNIKKMTASLFQMPNSDISKSLQSVKNPLFGMNETMLVNINIMNKSLEVKTFTVPDKNNPVMKSLMKYRPSTFQTYLNFLPKDSVAFLGFSEFNFEESLNLMTSNPDNNVFLKAVKNVFGIDIGDIYSNIQGDSVFAAFNTQDNPIIPGFAFFVNPKDKAKMAKTISSLQIDLSLFSNNMQRGNRKQREQNIQKNKEILKFSAMKEYKEQKIAVTNEIPDLIRFGIKPAFTFIDDRLIFASNEEVMKSIIDRILTAAPDFTLEKNDNFVTLKGILGENNNSLGYINLSTLVNLTGMFTSDIPDSGEVIANLKKFHSVGFSSINTMDGILGRIVILAEFDQIDFEKLFPKRKKNKGKIDIDKSKSTYY